MTYWSWIKYSIFMYSNKSGYLKESQWSVCIHSKCLTEPRRKDYVIISLLTFCAYALVRIWSKTSLHYNLSSDCKAGKELRKLPSVFHHINLLKNLIGSYMTMSLGVYNPRGKLVNDYLV